MMHGGTLCAKSNFDSFLTLVKLFVNPSFSFRWWVAYRDALSFRSSHYFVSFVSEASALVSGFGRNTEDDWGVPVTKPHLIEIPRSLVQVVVYWNMPMHHWLKTCKLSQAENSVSDYYKNSNAMLMFFCLSYFKDVFRTTISYGSFTAVLSTYAASSLLHGLNFQLSAVLLSLGAYTYVEYMLRQKLANTFHACILVSNQIPFPLFCFIF